MSLNDFLEKMREASWGKWPSKNRAIVERASADLASSGILDRILKVGDTAPDFTLSNAEGVDVNLHGLLAGGPQQPSAGGPQQPLVGGPVVIAFYRGHW